MCVCVCVCVCGCVGVCVCMCGTYIISQKTPVVQLHACAYINVC